jgi:hypothetical protein
MLGGTQSVGFVAAAVILDESTHTDAQPVAIRELRRRGVASGSLDQSAATCRIARPHRTDPQRRARPTAQRRISVTTAA